MIDKLIEDSQAYDENKTDFGPRLATDFSFHDETADLLAREELFNAFTALQPTDWAFGQICQKLGPACFPDTARVLPKDYLQACPSDLRAEQLNHWLEHLNGDRQWFVRAYDNNARAVLSERYATIGVTETLKWTQQALDQKLGAGHSVRFVNPVVSPDVLHLRMMFTDVDPGNDPAGSSYGVGGYITTGETGNRKLGAFPLIKRASCDNSIAIPKGKWSWESRHVGHSQALRSLFIGAIFHILEGSVQALEDLLKTQDDALPDFADYIDNLVAQKGWDSVTRDAILVGSEGHESLFGVIQGVSAAANIIEDPDAQANMQLVAGELLYTRR